ncbi:hypothetical protein RsTz2092_10310 [Deferribacterales bacterium RsTz2092]
MNSKNTIERLKMMSDNCPPPPRATSANISVIVPVHNASIYLRKCLDSLVNQTFDKIEIIIINNGSTDDSLKIIKEYEEHDSRIKVFDLDYCSVGHARNFALKQVTGMYIMSCDPDDWFELNACQKCYDTIEREQCSWAFFGMNVAAASPDMERYARTRRANTTLQRTGHLANRREMLRATINPSLCNKIIRKDVVDRYGITCPELNIFEDHAFFSNYLMVAETGYALHERLYNYYTHRGSLTDVAIHSPVLIFCGVLKYVVHVAKFACRNAILYRLHYPAEWCLRWIKFMCCA